METKRINLATMQDRLSRDEMKTVFAGSGGDTLCPGTIDCPTLEIGVACADVGESKGCTCRLSHNDHVCMP